MSPMDFAGIEEFKSKLDKNMNFLEDNFSELQEFRKNFFAGVISYYRTYDKVSDSQINSLLTGWRELVNKEGEV